jgi:hypothetical protein
MKTLFVATAAFAALVMVAPIGDARAAEPAKAFQRYYEAECVAALAPADKWTLRFDAVRRDVEFFRTNTPALVSFGPIAPTRTSWTAVLADSAGNRTNLAGLITPEHELNLTWVVGTLSGKMHCVEGKPATDAMPKS